MFNTTAMPFLDDSPFLKLFAVSQGPKSNSLAIAFLSAILGAGYALYRRATRISVAHLRGPSADSFTLGNLPEIFQSQVGEADFKYQREYGDVVKIKGPFGEDRLLISDPKALQYIFHTSGWCPLHKHALIMSFRD